LEIHNSVHIFVEGKVQGVGFRYFVKQLAEENNITGWVRNRYDDRVEITAQGNDKDLNQFISKVRVGPPSAHVTSLDLDWLDSQSLFERFSISPTI
jgi:acylphosphatase